LAENRSVHYAGHGIGDDKQRVTRFLHGGENARRTAQKLQQDRYGRQLSGAFIVVVCQNLDCLKN